MKRKLRGFKRKWQRMLLNLDRFSENITERNDEIFIEESFQYFNRKLSWPYKIELFNKLLSILHRKQQEDRGRHYLLWYLPEDIFESSILIFRNLSEVESFFKERQANLNQSEHSPLTLNDTKPFESYISDSVKTEEMVSALVHVTEEEAVEKIPVMIVADEVMIHIAKSYLCHK